MHKAYKLRLYPNKTQEVLLNKTFGSVRLVWNTLLAKNIKGFEEHGKSWKQDFNTTPLKTDFDFLKEVSAASLQQKSRDLSETYKQWFNSVSGKRKGKPLGYPRFKKKGLKDSYRLPNQKFKLFQADNKIQLEKIGKVTCRYPSDMSAFNKDDLVSVTITKSKSNKYYASVIVDASVTPMPKTNKMIGIDLGIKDLMTLSNNIVIKRSNYLKENQFKIKKMQQHLSRKKKDSKRYQKQRIKLAKLQDKIVNKRQWFIHNITKALVKDFDVICVESLDVKSMQGSVKNINRTIAEVSLYEVVRQLEYKCLFYDKTFVKVDKYFPSSQLCSCCGEKNKEIKNLKIIEWTCSKCGAMHHRDVNAAINILKEGFKDISGEALDYRRGDFINGFDYVKNIDNFVETLIIL